MKKTLLLSILLVGVVSGFAQGTVFFADTAPWGTASPVTANGHTDRLVYWTDNATALPAGSGYVAQLFYATGSGVSSGSLVAVDSSTKTFIAGGKWSPGNKTLANATAGINQTVTLQVRVWDGSKYATWDDALLGAADGGAGKAITGASAAFNYTVPAVGAPAAQTYMENFGSFTLQAAPEPTTIALGILGAASLLVVRRRK